MVVVEALDALFSREVTRGSVKSIRRAYTIFSSSFLALSACLCLYQ